MEMCFSEKGRFSAARNGQNAVGRESDWCWNFGLKKSVVKTAGDIAKLGAKAAGFGLEQFLRDIDPSILIMVGFGAYYFLIGNPWNYYILYSICKICQPEYCTTTPVWSPVPTMRPHGGSNQIVHSMRVTHPSPRRRAPSLTEGSPPSTSTTIPQTPSWWSPTCTLL